MVRGGYNFYDKTGRTTQHIFWKEKKHNALKNTSYPRLFKLY
jgi:hypothetical protein